MTGRREVPQSCTQVPGAHLGLHDRLVPRVAARGARRGRVAAHPRRLSAAGRAAALRGLWPRGAVGWRGVGLLRRAAAKGPRVPGRLARRRADKGPMQRHHAGASWVYAWD